MSYSTIIAEIESFAHFRAINCPHCNISQRHHVLQIHGQCASCGCKYRLRGQASIGSEIEDVIDAVLEWAGDDETFKHVMIRRQQIVADLEEEEEIEEYD